MPESSQAGIRDVDHPELKPTQCSSLLECDVVRFEARPSANSDLVCPVRGWNEVVPDCNGCPGFKRLSDVGFVEWNHKIETFSTCTADQTLVKCIRLGRLIWRLQHSQPQRLQRLIQILRIDTVTIMDNEAVSFVTAKAFSELLKRPLGRRMLSDVKVKDAPRVEFHDEHVDQPERCCHNDKEVG